MHVVYSETIKGVGLHEGGMYASSYAGAPGAGPLTDTTLSDSVTLASENALSGLIDQTLNL